MPQASDELRAVVGWITKQLETIPDDSVVTQFLRDRGYSLNPNWTWKLPKPDHHVTEFEKLCLRYMMEEWDYGWLDKYEGE